MADVQHFSGVVTPIASTTNKCGLVITPGAAPSTPEPGGVWYDIGDDAFALFSVDGTITYLPKGNGAAGQVIQSGGATSVPTWQTHGRMLHGVVPPVDLTDGVNGDFFLNTATSTLYGPKASGTWPAGVSIIGATGATGAGGATGPAGTGYQVLEAKQDQVVNNVTTLQSMCSFSNLTSGVLNTLTRRMIIKAEGFFTTAGGETPQLTFDIHMAAASQAAIQTDALTAGATGAWWAEFEFLTHTTGNTGTLYRSGKLHIQLAGTAVVTTYIYAPTSATGGMDLTGVLAPILTITATSNLGTIRGTICSLKVE